MPTGRHPCDDSVLRQSGGGEALTDATTRRWVLAVSVLGSSVAFVLSSVVNVALPALGRDLAASAAETQWVINAYLLPLGALILVGGTLGDAWGRTRAFVWGTGLMALATVACGLAPTTGTLIAARVVQGVGAALLVPGSLALLRAFFPEGERGQAIGTWAGAAALTSAAGPILGGALVDALSWRWVFFIVVPLAVAALVFAVWKVPESRPEHAEEGPLDWAGAVLAAVGLGALVFGLIRQSERGWGDGLVIGGLVAGPLLLAVFVWREARASRPMLPLSLFASRAFSGANALTLVLYFAIGAMGFLLPFHLIGVQGYSATQAGAAFLPFTLLMGGLSRWMGGQIETFGARRMLTVGPALAAVGLAMFALPGTDASYWTGFLPPILVLGLGMSIAVAPLTTVVMDAVDDDRAGTASGVNNAASRVAQLVAVAVAGVLALGVMKADLSGADLSGLSDAARQAVEAAGFNALQPPDGLAEADRQRAAEITGAAFVAGFRWTMGLAAVLALVGAGIAWGTLPKDD